MHGINDNLYHKDIILNDFQYNLFYLNIANCIFCQIYQCQTVNYGNNVQT